MTIICATDLNGASQVAGKVAARLALALGDDLVLVHVVHSAWDRVASLVGGLEDPGKRAAVEGQKLELEAPDLRELGCRVHTRLLLGNVQGALSKLALRPDTRLTVLGLPPEQRARKHRVVAALMELQRPVLVIPNQVASSWDTVHLPWHVAVGLGPHDRHSKVQRWVETLPKEIVSDVTKIRVDGAKITVRRQHAEGGAQEAEFTKRLDEAPSTQLLHCAKSFDVDILALTVSQGFWEPDSLGDIMAHSTMPILLVPSKTRQRRRRAAPEKPRPLDLDENVF